MANVLENLHLEEIVSGIERCDGAHEIEFTRYVGISHSDAGQRFYNETRLFRWFNEQGD